MPVDAKEMVPGFALASATSSLADLMPRLGRDDQHLRHRGDESDRCKIAQRIVMDVGHDMRRHRHRAGRRQEKRVTVGIGLGDEFAAERAVGPGLVVDDDALPERRLHLLGDDPADKIGGTSGRKCNHDMDRPVRKIIRLRQLRRGQRQQRGSDSSDQDASNFAQNFLPVSGCGDRESGINWRC